MLQVVDHGAWTHVTLDRPDVRNAFNDELIVKLRDFFLELPHHTRAVLLDGEGKVFSAGGDLNWMRAASHYTEEQNAADALRLAQLFDSIVSCRAVVVSKVHGAAFGGGCGLVCASDVAVAAIGTKFSFSEVRLGLIPATISSFVVPKIGAGHARALFTTGEVFDDVKALRIGLIHDVASSGELHSMAMSKVADVLKNGPDAVAMSKWVANQPAMPMEETSKMLAKVRASAEGQEGVNAFLDKRPASFVQEIDSP